MLFKKDTSSEPSVTITSLPQISESEPETSSTLKGSSVEEYLVIERERNGEEEGGVYEGDEKSSGSPSSNAPILPDILASRYMKKCNGSFRRISRTNVFWPIIVIIVIIIILLTSIVNTDDMCT